jgi:hypothetical protein
MNSNRLLTNISYGVMKAGLMVFLFPLFWQFIGDPGVENGGGNIAVSVVLSIVFVFLCFIIAVISRENFNLFGFMIVLLASFYKFFSILIKTGITESITPYFFLVCISIYFMTKVSRSGGR